jgi:hypothetical protein
MAFGVWRLAFGVWRLAFGVRRSAFVLVLVLAFGARARKVVPCSGTKFCAFPNWTARPQEKAAV